MNADQAISQMVAPGQKRANIWRNGVLQIWITRSCDKACFHCTQGSNLGGKAGMITLEQFEEAVLSLQCRQKGGYFGVVGMFGGNPAIHPLFSELVEILKRHVPFKQRGLWCNNPLGKGKLMRGVFNPAVSNLNVHQDRAAFDEFSRDWPECRKYLKGLEEDSRHGPPLVAMQDVIEDEEERWDLISSCDVNRHWSAMIGVVRGELKAYFCELAAAQAMLHQNNMNWMGTGKPMPDTGLPVTPGWWRKPIQDFADQIKLHCHACGIPLKAFGSLANGGPFEQHTVTHSPIMKFKKLDRQGQLIETLVQLGEKHLPKATDYIQNSGLK